MSQYIYIYTHRKTCYFMRKRVIFWWNWRYPIFRQTHVSKVLVEMLRLWAECGAEAAEFPREDTTSGKSNNDSWLFVDRNMVLSRMTTLWLFNVAMENGPFIDDRWFTY